MRPILITLSLNFLFPPLPILPLHEILTVSRELRSHMKSSGVFGFRERECATCNNADDIRIPAGRAKTFPEEVRTYFFCLGNNGVISIMRWLNRKIEKKLSKKNGLKMMTDGGRNEKKGNRKKREWSTSKSFYTWRLRSSGSHCWDSYGSQTFLTQTDNCWGFVVEMAAECRYRCSGDTLPPPPPLSLYH